MRRTAFLAFVVSAGLLSPLAARGEVNVNINLGPPPPPPVVLASPPQLILLSGSPVYYAPDASINLFVYGGRYYSFHEGVWFFATTHRGPWAVIAAGQVPQPVIAVPVRYYKIPPGRAKKMRLDEPPGHAKGPHGCPPGLAKQGRC